VRHVEREMEITVGVRHRRVVDTFAAFEVDSGTMVSVMPCCNGGSLAELLRKQGSLSEKDARSVMLQVWSS
jgi:tousled-like kinase